MVERSPRAAVSPLGTVIAGYRVERVLGTGGMGAVYLVANPELPRRDALKVLSAGLSRDRQFRARFIREADVASQLDHPNIVSIYRRGETPDGLLWIAMQFVDGMNGDEALRTGPMDPRRAIHIASEVAKALDYAHQRGVIHRDIKPANVLLSGPVGPHERVLLGDFGIARALNDVGLTGAGGVMATVSYAAPEVISGSRVDGRADLYSLGCTLFRLLSGRSPFAAAGPASAVMQAHLHEPPPRISAVAPWLPAALDPVMARALAKNPAQRFGSATELVSAAQAALHVGVAPRRAGSTGPLAGHSRPLVVTAVLAGVALLIAALVAIVVLMRGSDSGGPPGATTTSATATTTTTTATKTTTTTTTTARTTTTRESPRPPGGGGVE